MKLRRVNIERFRGIKKLEWTLGADFVCLLGPGDSTKTTILDAIEFVLSPRWNVPFDDSDFYDGQTDLPIVITATVGDLSEAFKSDAKYGYMTRGWTTAGELRDEPADGDELVLSIRLQVDSGLEPSWMVVNDRSPEGKPISAKDREQLGCARLGEYFDRHFSWARGSILSRLTTDAESVASILADAGRAARSAVAAVAPEALKNLHKAAGEAKKVGAEFGVAPRSEYRPHLDVEAMSVGTGAISLHDGSVPVRQAGLGTRRLLAIAMQWQVARAGGITLVDEIEHGLEPHRLRRLLRLMRGTEAQRRHVIVTTHSPVVLQELDSDELGVVRCQDGVTRVLSVPPALRPIVRKASEAFLGRKVLVCEGRTELGLCRRLDAWWSDTEASFALAGVALADGGGTDAPSAAKAFAELEYEVALFGDSDRPLNPDQPTLESAGVRVVLWDEGMALEERVAQDLPWEGLAAVVRLAMTTWGEAPVRDATAARLSPAGATLTGEPRDWPSLGFEESELRRAIGTTAKQKRWFKRVDLAEELGGLIVQNWGLVENTDLGRKISAVKSWAHENE